MIDLTEKYVGKKLRLGGRVVSPNYAFLVENFPREDIRFYVMQGGTRCFAPEQRVVVFGGGSKAICDLVKGDVVKTFNEATGIDEWKGVNEVMRFDNRKSTVNIRLKNGSEIVCNLDHKFYFRGEWLEVAELLVYFFSGYHYLFDTPDYWLFDIEGYEVVERASVPVVYDISVEDNHNYYLDCGGKEILVHNSTKTYSAVDYIWDIQAAFNNVTVDIVRQGMPTLKGTVMQDFIDIGYNRKLYRKANHNLTESIYRHEGNMVRFFGADDEEKIRGRKRDILYMNEAPELSWDVVQQLLWRTSSKIIIDYNPSMLDSWVYDKILTRDDCVFIKTTYKDNPFLTKGQIADLEWMRVNDPEQYLIFGLGEKGEVKGQVYKHWKRIRDNAFPVSANVFVVDFGYSPDPTCISSFKFDGFDVYCKELVYQKELLYIDIAIHLFYQGYNDGSHYLIADSADKRGISELRYGFNPTMDELMHRVEYLGYEFETFAQRDKLKSFLANGLTVYGANKNYGGSKKGGIKRVQGYNVMITEDSKNAWNEFTNYRYKLDHNGYSMGKPIDANDHFCDTLLYAVMGHGRYY